MPTISIQLTVPAGTTVSVLGLEGLAAVEADQADPIERYWRDYLSDNGRKIYAAAARLEEYQGSFSLEDIANVLSVDYESAKSMHRTSGRTARVWRSDTGNAEPPIRLIWIDYEPDAEHGGSRTTYRLPPSVADAINTLGAGS